MWWDIDFFLIVWSQDQVFEIYSFLYFLLFKQYKHILRNVNCKNPLWEVECYDTITKKNFKYVCCKVVLATGTADAHNTLNVDGELSNPEWVFHDVKQFENAVIKLKKNQCAKG